jgi:hypothetical protein
MTKTSLHLHSLGPGKALLIIACLLLPGCGYVSWQGNVDISDPLPDISVGLTLSCAHARCGYVNSQGELVIPRAYKVAKPFYEGVASVYVENVGWGAIDPKGNYVVQPTFAFIGPFSEGLAAACLSDKNLFRWAYIDHEGKTVIELNYNVNRAFPFHGGKAWVGCPFLFSGMSKLIDRSGHVEKVILPR